MNLETAWKNIELVVGAYVGNLEAHKALQQSMQTIRNELAKVPSVSTEPLPTAHDETAPAAS